MEKKAIKAIRVEWQEKLKVSGFKDIEDLKGNLKAHDLRTKAFEDREFLREFFLKLDHLMTHYPEMPKDERLVLELYTKGVFSREISRQLKFCYTKVKMIIGRYKYLIRAIQRAYPQDDGHNP